ncbi:MAG: 2-oxoacid:acceptor oxidoreductase family protein [Candidatus Limnocylindrales bacterium]
MIFAGFGGQGLLFAGHVLAQAALDEGREVFWIPSYGPEMRGGTAACTVIIGDRPIGSPVVDQLDALVVLNPPSLAKYEALLAPGGLLIINDSLVEAEPRRTDVEVVRVRCTAIATKVGSEQLTAVAALGALIARLPLVDPGAMRTALAGLLEGKAAALLDADLTAFEAGFVAASEQAPSEAIPSETVAAR